MYKIYVKNIDNSKGEKAEFLIAQIALIACWLSMIVNDCQRLSMIVNDCQRLSMIANDCQWLPMIVNDCLHLFIWNNS
jgi:hypothetical protein